MQADGGKLGPVDRFIDRTEKVAGLFLAAIAALVFCSIALRATVGFTIPEWYDLSRLMLAVTVFWGLTATSYRNHHIKVDILWEWAGPGARRWIDIFATLVLFGFLIVFSVMLAFKVTNTFQSNEATFDLRLAVWPFHLVAALGILFATILVAIRLVRLCRGSTMPDSAPPQVE
jgi:TRAP-type C4-dicarboxylate transport system permease small subunit